MNELIKYISAFIFAFIGGIWFSPYLDNSFGNGMVFILFYILFGSIGFSIAYIIELIMNKIHKLKDR